eukprot:4673134-Prymnesium_polylepis.1
MPSAGCAVRLSVCALTTAALWAASRALRGGVVSPYFSFVDNPLPSLPLRTARLLSAAHVHVRYGRLLLWPATLSADYSYDCIPMVSATADARNLAALALYAALGSI